MYLDEHGIETMSRLDLEESRYLSLTGVIMDVSHARDYLVPAFNEIKARVFDKDPDSPIIFHRSDIRHSKGPFECLNDPTVRQKFDKDILEIFEKAEYRVITALLDKKAIKKKDYWAKTHPYHVLMEIMVEKYAQLLERLNSVGDIMPEGRNKKQDKALQEEFSYYKKRGTRYAPVDLVRKSIPSSNLKFRTKKENVAGLQLCDLLAHPSHYTVRQCFGHKVTLAQFSGRVSKLLEDRKYDRSDRGKIDGYGIKKLP